MTDAQRGNPVFRNCLVEPRLLVRREKAPSFCSRYALLRTVQTNRFENERDVIPQYVYRQPI